MFFYFADLSATLSNTRCWEGFDWSVDKEVLLSDEFMYFYLLLFNCASFLLKKNYILFKIAEGSFSICVTFIMMKLIIAFIALFMFFVVFAKVDWFAWKEKTKQWALEFSFTG